MSSRARGCAIFLLPALVLSGAQVAAEDAPKPVVQLKATPTAAVFAKGKPLVFEATAPTDIHRPAPEHFKLTRLDNGKEEHVSLGFRGDGERGAREVFRYNTLWRGARLIVASPKADSGDLKHKGRLIDLYSTADLKPGVRYRLTWACWPVGAQRAVEVIHEFELAAGAP
jgi:hypothetical protein